MLAWLSLLGPAAFEFSHAFLPTTDPEYADDADAGQPLELYGVGYRNGFSLATWTEFTPFTPGNVLNPSVRSAFALGLDAGGAPVDVSNSVRERWTPQPFAVGTIAKLKPGSLIPINTKLRFSVDVARPGVQEYLRTAVDAGRLRLSVTSLTKVLKGGLRGAPRPSTSSISTLLLPLCQPLSHRGEF